MANRSLITPELCRQLLRYEPETGKLFWRERPREMFVGGLYPTERRWRSWNGRCANREAFTTTGSHGYREGAIHNINFLAHRVIWAMQTGEWPEGDIDHIDGDRQNNRWANFRSVSHAINLKNAAGKTTNTSGVTGVSWRTNRGKWRARIMVDGRERSLGHFDNFADAVAAREVALRDHGFTQRHGRLP